MPNDQVRQEVEHRNLLRAEAGLPLLDLNREIASAVVIRAERDFDQAFEAHLAETKPAWRNAPGSWMTRLGCWAQARRKFQAAGLAAYRDDASKP